MYLATYHRMDYGTTAIVRFLRDKIHHAIPDKKMTNVYQICVFFQAAMKVNADRVLGPENPMTYAEIVAMYNSMDWNTSLKEGFHSSFKVDKFKKTGVKRPGSDLEPSNKKRESDGSDSCYAFNSEKGCNRSSGGACFKYDRWFKHQCSHILADGSVCGASDHGNVNHP